jgi:hypothetical protein
VGVPRIDDYAVDEAGNPDVINVASLPGEQFAVFDARKRLSEFSVSHRLMMCKLE